MPMPAQLLEVLVLVNNPELPKIALTAIGYDNVKSPIESLNQMTIRDAFSVFKRIEGMLMHPFVGDDEDLAAAMEEYYTLVPYTSRRMITRTTLEEEKQRLRILYSAALLTSSSLPRDLPRLHSLLPTSLQYLSPTNRDCKVITASVKASLSETDPQVKIKTVLAMTHADHRNFDDSGTNRRLLWHGAEVAEWFAILSTGLGSIISLTGGLSFTESFKEAAAACPSKSSRLLLLAEVAVGGTTEFNPKIDATIRGVVVRHGSIEGTGEKVYFESRNFVITEPSQIKSRYAVLTDFS